MRIRDLAKDSLDVGAEADVEHPVGLVEDDVEDVAQVERTSLDVVDARGRECRRSRSTPRCNARSCFSIGSPP